MFGWFKRKSLTPSTHSLDPRLQTLAEKWFEPTVLSVAIAETVSSYYSEVKAGRTKSPVHLDRDAGVLEMWRGVRLEALGRMFGFGEADLTLLAKQQQQVHLINCFLNDCPHLEMPQPRGEQLADTIQAFWQIYVYLSEVGSEVADRETDRMTLRLKGNDILTSFTNQAKQAQKGWLSFEHALKSDQESLPELPPTIIQIIYKDVTKKSKSIALSTKFGPKYEQNIDLLRKNIMNDLDGLKSFDETLVSIMKAKDPDKL